MNSQIHQFKSFGSVLERNLFIYLLLGQLSPCFLIRNWKRKIPVCKSEKKMIKSQFNLWKDGCVICE